MANLTLSRRGPSSVRMRFKPGLVGATGSVTPEMVAIKDQTAVIKDAAAVSAQIAQDAASDATAQSNVPLYSSRAAVVAGWITVPPGLSFSAQTGVWLKAMAKGPAIAIRSPNRCLRQMHSRCQMAGGSMPLTSQQA